MKFLRTAILTVAAGAALAVSAAMAQYPPPETPTPTTPPGRPPSEQPPGPPNTGEGISDGDDGSSLTYALIAVGGVVVAGAGAYAVYGGTRRS
jgi:hypothetical protein